MLIGPPYLKYWEYLNMILHDRKMLERGNTCLCNLEHSCTICGLLTCCVKPAWCNLQLSCATFETIALTEQKPKRSSMWGSWQRYVRRVSGWKLRLSQVESSRLASCNGLGLLLQLQNIVLLRRVSASMFALSRELYSSGLAKIDLLACELYQAQI